MQEIVVEMVEELTDKIADILPWSYNNLSWSNLMWFQFCYLILSNEIIKSNIII